MQDHTISPRVYTVSYLVLLVLTALTTAVAYIDLGVMNTVVALVIAALKAAIIALFFMHLVNSEKLVRVIGFGALVWLGIMLTLTLGDYVTRGWVPVPGR